MAIVVSTGAIAPAALYDSILQAVYALTARPDLVNETALAIRKATMKAHCADFWKNDLTERVVAVTPLIAADTSFRYNFDLTDRVQYPLYRKMNYIKEYNATPPGQELQFKEKDADSLLDSYSLEGINQWYQAGMQVSLRVNKSLSNVKIGYWKYPNVISTAYDSWIAQQAPDIIVEEACAQIFKVIGKDSEHQRLAANFMENLHMLTMTQV